MRWLLLTMFALVLPTAGAAPVPKHLMKDEPYWPTAVGTKWVYEQGGKEMPEEITHSEPLKGGVRLTLRAQGMDRTTDVGADGVIQRTLHKWTLDIQTVRLPLKVGDTWAFRIPIQDGLHAEAGTMTVGEDEDVKVPAGKFRATKVVQTVTEAGGKPVNQPYTYTSWYAKGVGLVKMEWTQWGGGSRELKSFAPAYK